MRYATGQLCSFDPCHKPVSHRGLCVGHVDQMKRNGSMKPLRLKRPKDANAEQWFWTLVNKTDDGCWEWLAGHSDNGYGTFHEAGKTSYAHRVAYEYIEGAIPAGKHIDHVCHKRDCVNPAHMMLVDQAENNQNLPAHGRTGVRGVTFDSRRGTYYVRARGLWGGSYSTLGEAEEAAIGLRNRVFTNNSLDWLDPYARVKQAV